MSIEAIKTVGLRSLGVLFVLAGAALLMPSPGLTEKRLKSREQAAASREPVATCLRPDARPEDCRHTARTERAATLAFKD